MLMKGKGNVMVIRGVGCMGGGGVLRPQDEPGLG